MLSLNLRLPSLLSDSLKEVTATSNQTKLAVQSLHLKIWLYMLNMYIQMWTDFKVCVKQIQPFSSKHIK